MRNSLFAGPLVETASKRLPPLPCTCTMIVVSAGGLSSGCQSAAWILNPSITLIARIPERRARQRLYVIGETGRRRSGFVLDARDDLGHAYRTTEVAREQVRRRQP
jgi:hypothetical protein